METKRRQWLEDFNYGLRTTHGLKLDMVEERHDIAKERWEWCPIPKIIFHTNGSEGIIRVAENMYGTDDQMELMAAAPELANLMRDEINDMNRSVNDRKERLLKRIKLLRRLGIPHVALWYKEGSDD